MLALVLILVASATQSGCFYREREPPAADAGPSEANPPPSTILPPSSTPSPDPPPPVVENKTPAPPPLASPGFARVGDPFAVGPEGVRAVQLAIAYAESLDEHMLAYREPASPGVGAAIRFARVESGSGIGIAAGHVNMAQGTFASPSIAWNPESGDAGEYLAAWVESPRDAPGTLRIQRLSRGGASIGPALNLTAPVSGAADVVALGTGFLVAYEEPGPSTRSLASRAIGVGVHAGNAYVATPTPLTLVADDVVDAVALGIAGGSRALVLARITDADGSRVLAHVIDDSFTVSGVGPVAAGEPVAPLEIALLDDVNVVIVTHEGARVVVSILDVAALKIIRSVAFGSTARVDAIACVADACGVAFVTDAGHGVSGITALTNLSTSIARTESASFTRSREPPRDINVAVAPAGSGTIFACVAGVAQGSAPACARFVRT